MVNQLDPNKLAVAFNREMRRKIMRKLKAHEKLVRENGIQKVVTSEMPHISKPVSHREAVDRTADQLVKAMAEHVHAGTNVTIQSVLDRAEAAVVERAWRAGQPIPREQVRRAIAEIYARGEAQRAAKGK